MSVATSNDRVPFLPYSLSQTHAMWLLSLAMLGLALRYLTKTPSWQRHLTTTAFPVYFLHLPLLVITVC
jgi:hypothetical protein